MRSTIHTSKVCKPSWLPMLGLGLLLNVLLVAGLSAAEVQERDYPLMAFDLDHIHRMMLANYQIRQPAVVEDQTQTLPSSLSLLNRLPYTPAERDQGNCGDCWQWASTGVMEIAHSVQNGVMDRLSVQFINSCNPAGCGCSGGNLDMFAEFYSAEGYAIPWSNANAKFWNAYPADGSCSGAPMAASIAKTPCYPITSIAPVPIKTVGVSQAQAIANIKTVLSQNKAIYFGFYMAQKTDWDQFKNFWRTQPESALWSNFYSGQYPDAGQGGHAVLCVGYNDSDPSNRYWIMVNSWGTTSGRPNGVFHVAMDIDYSAAIADGENTLFWYTLDVQFASAPAAPANDQCSGAITISGLNYTNTQSTASATSVGDPTPLCQSSFGNGVWYKYTPGASGQMVVDTVGSDFDTVLGIYSSSMSYLGGDDDSGGNRSSKVTNSASAGTTYYILAGGFNSQTGKLVLHLLFNQTNSGPSITSAAALAGAKVGSSYSQTLTATGGAAPYSWSVSAGALPSGLTLSASGLLSGTPTAPGSASFTVCCTDSKKAQVKKAFSLTVTGVVTGYAIAITSPTVPAAGASGCSCTLQASSSLGCVTNRLQLPAWVTRAVVRDARNNMMILDSGSTLILNGQTYTMAFDVSPNTNTGSRSANVATLTYGNYQQVLTLTQSGSQVRPAVSTVFVKGVYTGLFQAADGTHAGRLSLSLTEQGNFSAKLSTGATSCSFSGRFSSEGLYSTLLARTAQGPLTVVLSLAADGQLGGRISGENWTADLTARRAVYSKANPAPQAGRYTLAIAGGANAATEPGGYGFASLRVDAAGNLSFSGMLGDGTKVTQSTSLTQEGEWPLYLALYSGKGSLLGWLTFTNGLADRDLTGVVSWFKAAQPSARLYPSGFAMFNQLEVVGSAYSFTNGISVPGWSQGELVLDGGSLVSNLTTTVLFCAHGSGSGANKLSLTFTSSTGLFQGHVVNPATGKPVSFQGALLQKAEAGYGCFASGTQSGLVELRP